MAADNTRQILADFRNRLSEDRRKQDLEAREKAEREAQSRREAGLFRALVGDATPIDTGNRVLKSVKPPPPVPLHRKVDSKDDAGASAPFSDGADDILPTGDDAPFARDGVAPHTLRKLRRGDPAPQATLDLHGMNRDQARNALSGFLQRALQQGFRCVRVVHGKGISSSNGEPVLKTLVQRWLTQSGQVLGYVAPPPDGGGDGALLVLLQPRG